MKKLISIIFGLCLVTNSAAAYEFGDWSDEESIGGVVESEIDENLLMGTIAMSGEFLDGDILKISVDAEDVLSPVLGISFHLYFEPDKLAFLRYEPGEFLERGGDPFYLVQNFDGSNEVIFGETLRREDSFPVGSGNITLLFFQILDGEEFNFEFSNGVVSTLDVVRQDLDHIDWEDLSMKKGGESVYSNIKSSVADLSVRKFSFDFLLYILFPGALIVAIFVIFLIRKSNARLVNFK